jgi:hypothetical protein
VAHWWGVGPDTAWKWRKALDVGRRTAGTKRLQHEHALEPGIAAGRAKAHAQSRVATADAARREKIAARRGKPRPVHVIEAMIANKRGKPLSAEHRRKLSAADLRRGARPPKAGRPWTTQEDGLVCSLPAPEAAAGTGRPLCSVYTRRRQLKLPDGRARRKIGGPTHGSFPRGHLRAVGIAGARLTRSDG